MALTGRGYDVHICAESWKGVEMAAALASPPSLLITDIHMAGMSGPELAAQMVAEYPGLKILFVSGYAGTNEQVREALSFENAHFLRKPFSLHEFRDTVQRILAELQA